MEEETFWSTVAQLSPVLALALVIEIRLAAARFTDPQKFRAGRWLRLYYALSYFAAFVILTLSFMEALVRLRSADGVFLSSSVVTLGLLWVFAILVQLPIQTIAGAMVADFVTSLLQAVPWSLRKRSRRRAKRIKRDIDHVERQLRESRLEAWSAGADLLVRMSRTLRARPADRALARKYDDDLAHIVVRLFELTTRRRETERVVGEVRQELAEISTASDLNSFDEDFARRLSDLS